jgi:uncharacterized membrane protein
MADQTPKKTPSISRKLRVLLIASLAVNFVVAGLVIGAVFGNKKYGGKPPRDGDLVGAFTQQLSDKQRRDLGKAIRSEHQSRGYDGRVFRNALQDVLTSLRAVPYDPAATQKVIEVQADKAFERRMAAQSLWLEGVAKMTDEERQAYADRIEEALEKRKRKGGPPQRN